MTIDELAAVNARKRRNPPKCLAKIGDLISMIEKERGREREVGKWELRPDV